MSIEVNGNPQEIQFADAIGGLAGKNIIINGGFDFWTRGITSTVAGTIADRWYHNASAATTFTKETTITAPRADTSFKMTAGATATMYIQQAIETNKLTLISGQTITLSAHISGSVATPMSVKLFYSTVANNPVSGTWTAITAAVGGTGNSGTSPNFSRVNGTFVVPSNALSLLYQVTTTSTVASGVIIYVGNCQVEQGNTASPFTRSAGDINLEVVESGSAAQDGVLVSTNAASGTNFSGTNNWAGYNVAGKNAIINGGMDIWQRNTSSTSTITAATAGTTTAYTAANTFVVGQYVSVAGITPTTLNGYGVVTAATATTFTLAVTTTGTYTSGGTAYGQPVYVNPTTSSNAFTADRWISVRGSYTTGITTTQQYSGLPGLIYCARVQRNAGDIVTAQNTIFAYNIETLDSLRFTGQYVTVSFWARAGANYSSAANAFSAALGYGTGTDQSIIVGYTGQTTIAANSYTLTTSWQRFSYNVLVPSTATQLGLVFSYAPTGTAGANDYFEITGVQLELGTTATSFSRAGGNIAGELHACQRYYWRFGGDVLYQTFGNGTAFATTSAYITIPNPVTMRANASSIDFLNLALQLQSSGAIFAITGAAIAVNQNGKNALVVTASGAVGLTVDSTYLLLTNNSISGYLGISAELV
jgi:hypothetical protein